MSCPPHAIAGVTLTCLTCCLAALPYVGTVFFLPFLVFVRSYSLYFMEQFGPQWTFFTDAPEDELEDDVEVVG